MLIKNEKWYSVFVVSDVAFYQYVLILERGEMAAAYTLLKSYLLLTVQKKLSPLDFICWHIKKVISLWLFICWMKLLNIIKRGRIRKKLHCCYSQKGNRVEWTCTLLMDNCQHNLVNEIWCWNKGSAFNHSLRIIWIWLNLSFAIKPI